jgi:hypothetical protein
MSKTEEQEFIQYKYALAFYKLLIENKTKASENKEKGINNLLLTESIGDLSSLSGLRKATISYVLSGLSDVKATTIDKLLEALGKSYADFALYIDSFSEFEVLEYKKSKEKERADRLKKHTNKN